MGPAAIRPRRRGRCALCRASDFLAAWPDPAAPAAWLCRRCHACPERPQPRLTWRGVTVAAFRVLALAAAVLAFTVVAAAFLG